jgi:hypothetical protein
MKDHTEVAWTGDLPNCDLCSEAGTTTPAGYDAKTKRGPWGYLCEGHYKIHGIGLGLGKGQKLRVVPQVEVPKRPGRTLP